MIQTLKKGLETQLKEISKLKLQLEEARKKFDLDLGESNHQASQEGLQDVIRFKLKSEVSFKCDITNSNCRD